MPSRWAVAAAGATLDLEHAHAALGPHEPTTRTRCGSTRPAQWAIDMGVLIALGVICGFAVARLLRRHEPEVMRK